MMPPRFEHKPIVSGLRRLQVVSFFNSLGVCPAGSLVARASSIDSSAPDRVAQISYPHWTSIDRPIRSEKILRELRSRAATVVRERADTTIEDSISSGQAIQNRRVRHHETDGGVRLAGGRVEEPLQDSDDFDQLSTSDGSTLPPPYSSDFGEIWCVCLKSSCCPNIC